MTVSDVTAALSATALSVGYGATAVVKDVDLTLPRERVTAIIGPNGCGKSTLLKGLCRLLPLLDGKVSLGLQDITTLSRKELAQRVGVLPQSPLAPEGLLVADLVARGRHPHQSWYKQWSKVDEKEVARALQVTGVLDLADRPLDTLSGGQRQRVWLAMVLAQNTDILFLDEPTTYLDLAHSIGVLKLVRKLCEEHGRTIAVVLHDLNLAVRYADQLVVMRDGAIVTCGTPGEVISAGLLKEVFGLSALVVDDPVTHGPLIVPTT